MQEQYTSRQQRVDAAVGNVRAFFDRYKDQVLDSRVSPHIEPWTIIPELMGPVQSLTSGYSYWFLRVRGLEQLNAVLSKERDGEKLRAVTPYIVPLVVAQLMEPRPTLVRCVTSILTSVYNANGDALAGCVEGTVVSLLRVATDTSVARMAKEALRAVLQNAPAGQQTVVLIARLDDFELRNELMTSIINYLALHELEEPQMIDSLLGLARSALEPGMAEVFLSICENSFASCVVRMSTLTAKESPLNALAASTGIQSNSVASPEESRDSALANSARESPARMSNRPQLTGSPKRDSVSQQQSLRTMDDVKPTEPPFEEELDKKTSDAEAVRNSKLGRSELSQGPEHMASSQVVMYESRLEQQDNRVASTRISFLDETGKFGANTKGILDEDDLISINSILGTEANEHALGNQAKDSTSKHSTEDQTLQSQGKGANEVASINEESIEDEVERFLKDDKFVKKDSPREGFNTSSDKTPVIHEDNSDVRQSYIHPPTANTSGVTAGPIVPEEDGKKNRNVWKFSIVPFDATADSPSVSTSTTKGTEGSNIKPGSVLSGLATTNIQTMIQERDSADDDSEGVIAQLEDMDRRTITFQEESQNKPPHDRDAISDVQTRAGLSIEELDAKEENINASKTMTTEVNALQNGSYVGTVEVAAEPTYISSASNSNIYNHRGIGETNASNSRFSNSSHSAVERSTMVIENGENAPNIKDYHISDMQMYELLLDENRRFRQAIERYEERQNSKMRNKPMGTAIAANSPMLNMTSPPSIYDIQNMSFAGAPSDSMLSNSWDQSSSAKHRNAMPMMAIDVLGDTIGTSPALLTRSTILRYKQEFDNKQKQIEETMQQVEETQADNEQLREKLADVKAVIQENLERKSKIMNSINELKDILKRGESKYSDTYKNAEKTMIGYSMDVRKLSDSCKILADKVKVQKQLLSTLKDELNSFETTRESMLKNNEHLKNQVLQEQSQRSELEEKITTNRSKLETYGKETMKILEKIEKLSMDGEIDGVQLSPAQQVELVKTRIQNKKEEISEIPKLRTRIANIKGELSKVMVSLFDMGYENDTKKKLEADIERINAEVEKLKINVSTLYEKLNSYRYHQ